VATGLSVPGDPGALEQLAGRLEFAGQGADSLGSNTREFTTTTLSDAEWTGDAADSFSAFGANLGEGAGAVEGPLSRIASAVRNYAGSLRTAQQQAQAYNSIAEAAQNDSSGSLISAAENAGQNAMDAISAMQEAGSQAAAEVTSAAGDLQDLFGNGPVQSFMSTDPGLGEIPFGGWTPGDPIPPDLGPEILDNPGAPDLGLGTETLPPAPDLGLPQGDPIPPELGLPEGDPIPTGLGPEILGNPGGWMGPLINFNTPKQPGDEPEDGGDSPGDDEPPVVGQVPDSNDTIHSTLRGGERGIDPSEVMGNAENVYYDENGNQVYVWEQPDGTTQITIRDPANGNIVTNQRSTGAWVQAQVDKGRWFGLG
jgi:uncharacterized protein YukE